MSRASSIKSLLGAVVTVVILALPAAAQTPTKIRSAYIPAATWLPGSRFCISTI